MARRHLRRSASLVVAATTLVMPVTMPAASAQTDIGARIHVVLTNGPRAGEHDAEIATPCVADLSGPGNWYVGGMSYRTPLQSIGLLIAAPGSGIDDDLSLSFYDQASGDYLDYVARDIAYEVTDRGSTATITGSGDMQDKSGSSPDTSVQFSVDCLMVEPPGRAAAGETPVPAPVRTPLVLGSPAPGAAVFHVDVATGPHAGIYDLWSLDTGCQRGGDGSLMARYLGARTEPSSITVVALDDEVEEDRLALVEVGFTAPDGPATYIDLDPIVEVVDDGSTLTIEATSDSAMLRSWPDDGGDSVEMSVSVRCSVAP